MFSYLVTDSAGGQLGELRNAANRRVGLGINRNPFASARIRLDDPLANAVLGGTTILKVYEGGPPFATPVMRFVGRTAAVEEVGDESGLPGSLTVTWGGPFTLFGKRLLGKTSTGYTDGTALAPKDKSTLLEGIVSAANAIAYTGVEIGTAVHVGSTSYLAYTPYKKASDAITELVNGLDGPDFELVPQEPQVVGAGLRLALMNVMGAVGQARPAAAFEYGVGRRNVKNYARRVNYDLANAAYGLPSSSNPGGTVVSATDTPSIVAFGRQEELISTDLDVDPLRQKLVEEHVRVRKAPQQIITFTPSRDDASQRGRVPRFGVDFGLGDAIPFRAVSHNEVRVNASLRVYAVDFDIDDLGAGTSTFTLTAD